MKLSTRSSRVVPSPTLSITAKAKAMAAQGIDVIDFSAGEPSQDTPDFIKDAGKAAIQSGFTKYTPVAGTDELRLAIVEKFQRDQGVTYDKSQILVSCGAKHSLYNLFQALIDPGDEVIIPAPYWVSYPDQVLLADGTPVILHTLESKNYAIDPSALEACITSKTKALILNSPSNPSGSIYSRDTLKRVAAIAKKHKVLVISDEIYEKLVFGDPPFLSIVTVDPEVVDQTVVVNGMSKAFAMTGWRIGYAAGPKDLIAAMSKIQGQSTSNPTSIAQKASIAALQGGSAFFEEMVNDLRPKRDLMVKQLNAIPGVTCTTPPGAFYAYPNVSGVLGRRHAKGTISTAADLATYLLEEAHLACVPGEPFGSPSHLRLSYTPTMDTIQRGMERFRSAIQVLS
ncbi:MAG: pyridoxal phosphate-dependent aminotransferase [Nitrospirae bacterium]|nr:pyridoxal phosphate-dependent aminotransferase [Nitrospirota bacterium]MDA1305217.1 pyridoxal phosphate-dependent aminotransferase [Nitrospirota bacterium]